MLLMFDLDDGSTLSMLSSLLLVVVDVDIVLPRVVSQDVGIDRKMFIF